MVHIVLTLVVNYERDTYHQQCHCRTQQEKYSTKCNFNASPMMMSFFNYYSRFLSLWCANTHLALYLQYWYLITLHLPPSLITFYCRIEWRRRGGQSCNKRSITFHMSYEKSLHTKSSAITASIGLAKPQYLRRRTNRSSVS